MITHVLAIAITIVGLLAFLSGYFYGKSDASKKLMQLYSNRTKEMIEAKQESYMLGRIHVAEEFKTFTNELEKNILLLSLNFLKTEKNEISRHL